MCLIRCRLVVELEHQTFLLHRKLTIRQRSANGVNFPYQSTGKAIEKSNIKLKMRLRSSLASCRNNIKQISIECERDLTPFLLDADSAIIHQHTRHKVENEKSLREPDTKRELKGWIDCLWISLGWYKIHLYTQFERERLKLKWQKKTKNYTHSKCRARSLVCEMKHKVNINSSVALWIDQTIICAAERVTRRKSGRRVWKDLAIKKC